MGTGGWGQGLEQFGPNAPSYRDYLAAFAKKSVPVNTMQVGQDLADGLGAKAVDANQLPQITLSGYTSKLAQALRNSQYEIDPLAQAALDGVQSDLQRATVSNSIRTGGSDTAYNSQAGRAFLGALGAKSEPGLGTMAAAGGGTLLATGSPKAAGAIAFGVKHASDFATKRVQTALAQLLLDPNALADSLQSATAIPALPGYGSPMSAPASALALALKKQAASPSNSPARR